MKILTIKEYLKEKQSSENMSVDIMNEELTSVFASVVDAINNNLIVFNKDEMDCFCTKLYTTFNNSLPNSAILSCATEIYRELLGQINEQNLKQIIIKGLQLTPIVIDADNNKFRGILAYLKYIK